MNDIHLEILIVDLLNLRRTITMLPLISTFLEHVNYLQLGHHCFFAPIPARSRYGDYAGFRKRSGWWSDFVTVQSKIDGSDSRTDYVVAEGAFRNS